jgi:DNA-binding response OmpR family regulator
MSKIMIVDDDANMRLLVEMAIRKNGDFTILSCGSGEAALKMVTDEKPDLVLLDVMMPGMNGYEVCRIIKSNPETKFTAVIIVSSLRDVNDKLKGMETGADDYMVKPFNPDELFGRIKARLRIQELEKELVGKKQIETVLSMAVTLQHEINNPLAGIMGNAEVLKKWQKLGPAEVDKSISAVMDQAKRIRDIVQKLATVTKVVESTYFGVTKMVDVKLSTAESGADGALSADNGKKQ